MDSMTLAPKGPPPLQGENHPELQQDLSAAPASPGPQRVRAWTLLTPCLSFPSPLSRSHGLLCCGGL